MSGHPEGTPRALQVLVRLSLWLYPEPFRQRFGDEMLEVLDDRWRDERASRPARLRLALGTLISLLWGALCERRSSWQRRPPIGSMVGERRARDARTQGRDAVDGLRRDVQFGLRMLKKSPGTTATALFTLTICIGANTAVFSLVNALLFQPLPGIREPERLAALYTSEGLWTGVSAYMDYLDLRERTTSFAELAAYKPLLMDLDEGEATERMRGMIVTANYFATLGLEPAVGRFFLPEEDRVPNGHPVTVLGYGLWKSRFAGDPEIAGKSILLNGRPFTVVGVAPEGFRGTSFESRPELFAPMTMQPHFMPSSGNLLGRRGWGGIYVIGRLAEEASLAIARDDVARVVAWLKETYPDFTESRSYLLEPFVAASLGPSLRQDVVRFGSLLMITVGIVLLVGCVNIANLFLARGADRGQELAIRRALGASRTSLLRQLVVEALILSGLGGVAGLALALWAARFVDALPIPFAPELGLDVRILAFTAGVTTLATLVFGLVPGLRATRSERMSRLRGAGGATAAPSGQRIAGGLVVAQVALSLLLLVVAGLFSRTLVNLSSVELGFDPENVLVATVDPALQGYEKGTIGPFYRELMERVEALPGVVAASLVSALPGPSNDDVTTIEIEGYTPESGERVLVHYSVVGDSYFETLGIPVLQGRAFTSSDDAGAVPVGIVNETAARELARRTGRRALDVRLLTGNPEQPHLDIVGIAADSQTGSLREGPRPVIYVPHRQFADNGDASRMTLLVRTEVEPLAVVRSLRRELRELDANVPLFAIGTLESHLEATLLQDRIVTTLLGLAAAFALVLATVGLYGTLSYAVAQRTTELGIRMALGAARANVLGLVVRQGLRLTAVGLLVGLVAARLGAQPLRGFLFRVGPSDLVTYFAVAGLMAAVAVAASYLPALRATRVDPIETLRSE